MNRNRKELKQNEDQLFILCEILEMQKLTYENNESLSITLLSWRIWEVRYVWRNKNVIWEQDFLGSQN